MIAHGDELQSLITALGSDEKRGLTSEKAGKLQETFGLNRLEEKKKKGWFLRFSDQFKDVMIIILLIAAAVSFGITLHDHIAGNGEESYFEPILILVIVILNAVMGVVQESKAEKALEALKNLSAPTARVVRDGKESIIDASLLVPGDIILIEAGDFVPADARLIISESLKSEESALTGESVPSEKDAKAIVEEAAPLGDRHNMLYMGCGIAYGRGRAIVTGTGMHTEMGKIATLLASESEGQTPLQQKLASLGKYLGFMALAACAVIFVIGLLNKMSPLNIFMVSVSLAVSAIPEGLPAIVTIVLAIGVQRMVKRNAIIRRLPAVETLGSASVICSDKTGTLTQNRMTLTKAFVTGRKELEDISESNSEAVRELLLYSTLCCDGNVSVEGEQIKHLGDPTETAIVYGAYRNNIVKDDIEKAYPRLTEIPFDSDRKLMTTVNNIDGKNMVIVKGAFDVLATRCIEGAISAAQDFVSAMAGDALRILAVACKEIDKVPETPTSEELECGLHFLGLLGMIDPPRSEAKEAVKVCRDAGIKPVMITGDHILTASAIAKELGIFNEGDKAITGAQLEAMSEEELKEDVRKISVYARVSPSDKIRIVRAWQDQGEVVAMTGDGVNDAPALKAADIGCAMGITGTDVAKGAADMTLTDDNFATIVDAVSEGRGIYDDIRKVVGFLLGTNIGEVLTVFFAMILWHKTPLVSMQLLWINLVTDSLPAITLGMEAVEGDVMKRKPKPKKQGIFAGGLGAQVIIEGIMFATLTLIGFILGQKLGEPHLKALGYGGEELSELVIKYGQTMAFFVLSLTQIVQSFNKRSNYSLFKIGFFTNKNMNLAGLISIGLIALVLFVPPITAIFELCALTSELYLIAVGLAFAPLLLEEIAKLTGLIRNRI
ncbi:MAG: cation-translocating P-type ATPase [Lachnospiraceae bacterium]|jgi:Ca2+-transporting ATPase|nr:cation-translocating P-type ATPase [Lachnospiraceae bacterium]